MMNSNQKEEEEIPPPERPPSPPPHTTLSIRGLHVRIHLTASLLSDIDGNGPISAPQAPTFSAFRPREFFRFNTPQAMTHVAWSCDGRKLGAVGVDKIARVWQPDKSVRVFLCSFED